jgi:tetratricopeptide (TPR) repeat protein
VEFPNTSTKVDHETVITTDRSFSETLPYPEDGVRLEVFLEFINLHCGGEEALKGKSTAYVSENFLKPATAETQQSFCELLKTQNRPGVSTANRFVSHAWNCEFLDVVNALRYYSRDEDQSSVYYFFDLFSNNQHKAPHLTFDWWSNTFKNAIGKIGHTVIVLTPWQNPIALTRAWCLFECYCTVATSSKFSVAMSNEEQRRFVRSIALDTSGTINKMLATIDVEQSTCYKEEDLEQIKSVVRETVGFGAINKIVFERFREWFLETVDRLMKEETDFNKRLDLMHNLAILYKDQGKYAQAEPLFVECLKHRREALGSSHPDTLSLLNNLALLYKNQGRYKEAEELYLETIRNSEAIKETDEEDEGSLSTSSLSSTLLGAMSNLALLYFKQGRYHEAEQLYLESLQKAKAAFGDDHHSTLTAMNNLAQLYDETGRYGDADELYATCLAKRRENLGVNHPDMLISVNNLALLYKNQGRLAEAEPLYVECLDKTRTARGDHHPDTLSAMNNLALLMKTQGRYGEAEPMFKECLKIATEVMIE